MKTILITTIAFLFITQTSYAQDGIAPAYLTKQDFPDSVTNLSILKLDGETTTFKKILDTHKGKKIVVDFWASWCRDCINGLPKLTKLMQETQEDDVVYILLSLDKEEEKWLASVKKYNINGEHYRITSGWKNTLTNYIGLDWIPRYIVLDESGKIILSKAITANDKKIVELIHN